MTPLGASVDVADALARIASALRTPVLILALLALLVCALESGRFAAEWWSRARAGRGALGALTRKILADPGQAAALSRRAPSAFAAQALLRLGRASLAGDGVGIEHALAEYELSVQRCLDRTRILIRAGPALGLMGTLIPLAPGLAALGRGDVATLATDLRTAFAATTIGLLVGTVAFALTLIRTRMYTEDLAALERAIIPTLATAPPDGQAGVSQPPAPSHPPESTATATLSSPPRQSGR